jgi:hypothetical protein
MPWISRRSPRRAVAAAGRRLSGASSLRSFLAIPRYEGAVVTPARVRMLGVSIDGARQETYERYRVRGDLETVLRNCRLLAGARRRLGSATPQLVWEFHVFPHNTGDVAAATALAADLGMEIAVSTLLWNRWRGHLAGGGDPATFRAGTSFDDGFNYFWNRRPAR